MTAAPLEPSWQRKFARAGEHLEVLAGLVQDFMAGTPYEAVEEIDYAEGGLVVHTWRGRINRRPPSIWSPLIGDCLNNLRSSLDHIVWALAEGRGDRRTAFPVFNDPDQYRLLAPNRHIRFVPSEVQGFIESLQPYHHVKGADAHFLHLLDRLTNDDKHRELLGTEVGVAHIEVGNPSGPAKTGDRLQFEFEPREGWFQDGSVFVRYRSSNPDLTVPLRFTFDVALDPSGSAHGLPLLSCLASLTIAVWIVLRGLEERAFSDRLLERTPEPMEGRANFVGVE